MSDPTPESDAAEAERYVQICRELRESRLTEFLDWLCEEPRKINDRREVALCGRISGPLSYTYETIRGEEREGQTEDDWSPLGMEPPGEAIFAAFFEIDLEAVERHRVRVLNQLRSAG
jgi:hypothetical protein